MMRTKIRPDAPAPQRVARQLLRGLYAVTPDASSTIELQRRVGEAIAGGARLVQYRNKSTDATLRREQTDMLVALCRARAVPLIVNDDIELARAAGADGVHLGRDDATVSTARAALGPDALIGVSCYDELARALAAEHVGASYVAFGSFFASAVKPGAVRAPLDLLQRARAATALPIVAIGGITAYNAAQLLASGADALAVISALFDTPDTYAAAQSFAAAFAASQKIADTEISPSP